MRACLLAFLMLFLLPLQWAGAAMDACCAHEHCAPLQAVLGDAPAQASSADALDDSHAQHSHCGSCHSGAMTILATAAFALHDATNRLWSGPKRWTEVLLSHRPERPQWNALA